MRDLTMNESSGFRSSTARGGWLVDEALFRLLVDFELQKAQRLRYSVSVVHLSAGPVSSEGGDASLSSLAEAVAAAIRGTDALAVGARGSVSILLVDAEASHLPAIVDRVRQPLQQMAW